MDAADLDLTVRVLKDRALKARDALAKRLSDRLGAAMKAGGPSAAVGVCRDEARVIATEVSAQKGVAIGRTSFKLRNPSNTAPAWAEPYVAERTEDDVFLVGRGGGLRVLLPIGVQPKCLVCHGDAVTLPEKVQATLTEHYPEDHATGFEAGDLRGWFWVEVPKE